MRQVITYHTVAYRRKQPRHNNNLSHGVTGESNRDISNNLSHGVTGESNVRHSNNLSLGCYRRKQRETD